MIRRHRSSILGVIVGVAIAIATTAAVPGCEHFRAHGQAGCTVDPITGKTSCGFTVIVDPPAP